MNSYRYRDARKPMLEAALAALGDEANDLRTPLQRELDALQQDDWSVSDRTYLAVGADWLWSIRLTLKSSVDDDPALLARGQAATLSDAQAAAIETLPHFPGDPPPDYLDQVRAALGGDETIVQELLFAGHRRWIVLPEQERAYPFADVGVLLPVRLETLFDEPGSRFNPNATRWQLSLRVIPDEASICRDNRHVSAGEQQALRAFWDAVKQPDAPMTTWLDGADPGDRVGIAWQQFCAQVTPARAAWLVANVETAFDGATVTLVLPDDMPTQPQPNRVGGLPPELQVIAVSQVAIDGMTQHPIGRLPMDADQVIDTSALTLPLPTAATEERQRWWSNWDAAKAVGLGGEWLLPEGMTPENIAALYVVGIGDESPAAHFRSQVDAGELGVLPLGAPTNTVQGQPAADLATDEAGWRQVAQMRLRQQADPNRRTLSGVGGKVQQHLIGDAPDLPFFPGADRFDDTLESRRLVQALWPALWGHWLNDLWQVGEESYGVGSWMAANFCPEGPLLPLRISDQPYGLLPVTDLSQWQSAPVFQPAAQAQAALEEAMARNLSELCAEWAAAVQGSRSVVGKTTEQFMQLLGHNAVSRRYQQRRFSPAWTQMASYITAFGLDQERQAAFLEQAREFYKPAIDRLGREPQEIYLATGHAHAPFRRRDLPLVQPTAMLYRRRERENHGRLPLVRFLELLFEVGATTPPDQLSLTEIFDRWWVLDEQGEYQLSTLPDSLLLRLLIYATQLAAPWQQLALSPAQEEVARTQQRSAVRLAKEFDQEAWLGEVKDEATGEIQRFTVNIPPARRSQLERALRATLDSAAHRIDPWLTGFAWQRLQVQRASGRSAHRLGVYGWVDGPFLGQPGPTDAGRLHTPSYNQTLTALILRDKFLSSQRAESVNGEGRNPWAMNLSSRTVRLAAALAEEVRLGFHIHEVVGRQVENIIGRHQSVKELRTSAAYAMNPAHKDPNAVCDGLKALPGLLAGDPAFPLTLAQQQALQTLTAALDAYRDLLMADGVMQVVNRQIDRAAETMEAAAGFARPPQFEFTHTPPSGYQLESLVLATLPYQPLPGVADDADPIWLADPSVAAFLATHLGADWPWLALDAAGQESGRVTLAELGFAPHETLALSAQFLRELAAARLGVEPDRIMAPRQPALAQQLVAALGSRPAGGRDVSSAATQPTADAALIAELQERYGRLRDSCTALITNLLAAPDDATHALHLRRALIWGVIPASQPADRAAIYALLQGLPQPPDATGLALLAQTVAELLQKRLDDAPVTPTGITTIGQAIATLASPNARLAILACWGRDPLLADSNVQIGQVESTLDESWLTVVAATRANLARLEALQLELTTPLTAWSSSPGDPWQQQLVAENLHNRDTPHERQADESVLGLRTRRLVATYGPTDAWAGDKVAVGLVDAFSEAIPMPQRTSSAAIGFNAPSARAPQAILLAVPPQPGQRLDAALVQQIVEKTRQLAHARMARMEDLGAWQALTPTLWLPTAGPRRAYLEPYPLFV
ncbi:MAG: hypothetical protein DYG89_03375 [Caldilinea sp. CFX5]|nr:hypothetical protein [Caldilinea sp. CFX5]